MKDLTLLTVRCRGAPEDNAFMLGKRASPHDNRQTNWRACARVAFVNQPVWPRPRTRPTDRDARGLDVRKWMRFFSLLLPAPVCRLDCLRLSKSQFECFRERNEVLFSCMSNEGALSGAVNQEIYFLIINLSFATLLKK